MLSPSPGRPALRTPRMLACLLWLSSLGLLSPALGQQLALIEAPKRLPPDLPRGVEAKTMLEQQLRAGSVVLLGDTHQNTQILDFLATTLPALARSGTLTHLALEIGADQQPRLDHFFATGQGLERLRLLPAIEHPGFRRLLEALRQAARPGARPLQVVAIDAPWDLGIGSRDAYMAGQLAGILTLEPDAKVLALVGNIHAVRGVRWVTGERARFIPDHLRMMMPAVKTFSIHQCVRVGEPDAIRSVLSPLGGSASRPTGYLASHPMLRGLQDDTLAVLNLAPGQGVGDGMDGVIFFPDP